MAEQRAAATMPGVFITGATGFVGKRLLAAIRPGDFDAVTCLVRSSPPRASPANCNFVQGDLLDADSYGAALAHAHTVVHLAAATGAASADQHFRVNAQATEVLIRQCQQLGVRRFLYVSSIAARFADVRHYPYAQSKRMAEQAVRQSTLRYLIVRPTIVLGPGSPVGERLQSLARMKVTPIIGSGTVLIQPIDVDDLAAALLDFVRRDSFDNQVIEIGGPNVVTMAELLRRMHRAHYGSDPRVIHLPLQPIRAMLLALERLRLPSPVRAGQLASFINDGVAEPVQGAARHLPAVKGIEEMLLAAARHD